MKNESRTTMMYKKDREARWSSANSGKELTPKKVMLCV